MMIHFIDTSLAEQQDLFREYLETLSGVNDDFWEEHVLGSRIVRMEMDGEAIGLTGIFGGENLTLFYVRPGFIRYAQAAFVQILEEKKPQYAFAATNDELFLSLCMDRQVSVEKQAYFFRKSSRPVREAEFPASWLRRATLADAEDILDKEGVEENIRAGRYSVMRKDGVFIGQGFFNRSEIYPHVASIGMSVHPDYRRQGVGRSIILHLTKCCEEKGLTPVCGCWYYNHNSKRTLESAGFETKTRLLKIWFTEQKSG